jgi:hypothetical protein
MAKVVWLKPGESPPPGETWAVVGRDVGKFCAGAAFSVPYGSDAQGPIAIEQAKREADQRGVPTVYVVPKPGLYTGY